LIRDVKHRWNFTHAMIQRARMPRRAIDKWVKDRDELHHWRLSNDEWALLESLGDILE
ncbi:hypothetical protein B0H13DRAFT_1471637, partial [Mycena leptocephala]